MSSLNVPTSTAAPPSTLRDPKHGNKQDVYASRPRLTKVTTNPEIPRASLRQTPSPRSSVSRTSSLQRHHIRRDSGKVRASNSSQFVLEGPVAIDEKDYDYGTQYRTASPVSFHSRSDSVHYLSPKLFHLDEVLRRERSNRDIIGEISRI
ncbi:hypothetical protein M422DRAFT_251653 [Sphaerobolus stellatus SS14]|uniref:Uncharacterized protein n=1 Tax=Sphaerobolus stellatus (strain SS14) TaxID=990650 RepID=A0A0C9W0P3_SPHS4|nr:hypothetical protein M422DRAFT_251653 [Sphaerobolus stellatus SS14]